jgi:hypothetical protein
MKSKKYLRIVFYVVLVGLMIAIAVSQFTDPLYSGRELEQMETMRLSREKIIEGLGSNYFDEDGIISDWNVYDITPGTEFYVRVKLKSSDAVYTDFEVESLFYRLNPTSEKKGSNEYTLFIQNDQLYIRFELSDHVHSKSEGKKIFKEQVEKYLNQITE